MNEHNSFNNNDILVDDNVTALTVDDDIRLNKFNWAAFFGGAIWSVFHKQYLIFIICIIPFGLLIELFTNEFTGNIVGSVLSLAVAIYLGKNGYRMAWMAHQLKYQTIDNMIANQKSWLRIILIVYITLAVCIIVFAIFVGIELYNSFNGDIPAGFWHDLIEQAKNYHS